jgi:hypothetical protein
LSKIRRYGLDLDSGTARVKKVFLCVVLKLNAIKARKSGQQSKIRLSAYFFKRLTGTRMDTDYSRMNTELKCLEYSQEAGAFGVIRE